MKKNLLFAIAVCSAAALHAQNPVPNPGFENWTAGNPDQWYTTNVGGGFDPITQTTPPYSGSLAAKGEVIQSPIGSLIPYLTSTDATGTTGFPVTQAYAALNFYYKTYITGSSVFYAIVGMNDMNQTTIGVGAQVYTSAVSSYTLATVPIFYSAFNVADCIISFTLSDTVSSPAIGNYFVVDEVSLSGTAGIQDIKPLIFSIEKIQPNPVSHYSQVYYSLHTNTDLKFSVYDITGRVVKEIVLNDETAGRHKMDLNVSDLPSGIYMVRMAAGSNMHTIRMQVVR